MWKKGKIVIIDQTKLPHKLVYKELSNIDDVVEAIINMRIRGAPLLGVAAALGLALVAYHHRDLSRDKLLEKLYVAANKLKKTRPTAVNLFNSIEKMLNIARSSSDISRDVVNAALDALREDIQTNEKIAEIGQEIIDDGDVILTHCNTGSLATVSIGTALGVITEAYKQGKNIKVYFTETRPKLQGARLTAFELLNEGIEAYLITDSAVAYTIKSKNISKVIVGADRILCNGTVYNKIGTYQIAIVSKELGAKFYVVAPSSTFDLQSSEKEVIIEEREKEEVIRILDCQIAPEKISVYNPAFDATPPKYIDGIITEKGLIKPPYERNIKRIITT
jgi:methylthioribose-1-phosphate isomerase